MIELKIKNNASFKGFFLKLKTIKLVKNYIINYTKINCMLTQMN